MAEVLFTLTGLYIFAAIFNIGTSFLMFYLRSTGGSEGITKGQLWGITILAWLFLLNGLAIIAEALLLLYGDQPNYYEIFPAYIILTTGRMTTALLLLMFGLVYPRPLTTWSRLRLILLGLMVSMTAVVAYDIMNGRANNWFNEPRFDPFGIIYIVPVFLPVHIWISQYSRQPSTDGRMMYTILIWGFLFNILTEKTMANILLAPTPTQGSALETVYLILIVITVIRLILVLWGQRKRWAMSETAHIVLFSLSLTIGIVASNVIMGDRKNIDPMTRLAWAVASSFGWMVVRPALFSYGLLRYRLLGTKVQAEQFLAIIGAALLSTLAFLMVVGLAGGNAIRGDPLSWDRSLIGGALLAAILLLYPAWMFSKRFVTRLLPMSAGAQTVSMKERRNTYLMALQTAVVMGRIGDDDDSEALDELRKELGVSEREHDLLMETIAVHEVRRLRTNEVEEAFLIHRDGRLIMHYEVGRDKTADMDEDSVKEVVAGMLTAVGSFVGEAMGQEEGAAEPFGDYAIREGRKASMDAVQYGVSTLVIEMDGALILALVLNGQDDPALRQAMRDVLAEVLVRHRDSFAVKWDGSREGLDDIWQMLRDMARRVEQES